MNRMSIGDFRKIKSRSKFNNSKTVYNGFTYDSRKEAKHAQYLDSLIIAKEIVSYEKQVVFKIEINGVKVCKYIADFVVLYADGTKQVCDVKSEYTKKMPVYRLKKKLLKAVHNIDIVEID